MKNLSSEIINRKSLFIFILLFLSIGERVLFDLGPNVELITLSMLLAASYLGRKEAFWIVLVSIVFTDIILGNSNIFIFTWSGFLIPAIFASIYLNKLKESSIKLLLKSTIYGFGTGVFFFTWTNFGVWFLDSWGMYSNDLIGLLQCYINALPFFRMQILSNLIIVPAGFLVTETLKQISKLATLSQTTHAT